VKVAQILNELATEMFPGKYNSDFAVQVTSWIPTAQEDTIKFTNNNLKGNSKWLDGYRSSKARMCVTVGMMTTGYDCPDVLNLALMRPIFSPTDFIQIKGRGTRKNTFNYEYRDDFGDTQKNSVNKETYLLFDFFANCEYFEDKYDYDQILKLPKKSKGTGEGDPRPVVHDDFEYSGKDKISQFEREAVGVQGMKVDRMFFQDFETKISGDQNVKQLAKVDPEAAASYITENILDKPKEFFTIDKLRKALGVDRKISMREVVDKIFNGEEIKMKDDLLNEEFDKFLSIHKPSDDVLSLKYFFRAYLTDKKLREVIDSKNYGQLLSFDNFDLEDFKKIDGTYRDIIPQYIKSYVPINKFAA
jgi:type I restriction enzyme R subunit